MPPIPDGPTIVRFDPAGPLKYAQRPPRGVDRLPEPVESLMFNLQTALAYSSFVAGLDGTNETVMADGMKLAQTLLVKPTPPHVLRTLVVLAGLRLALWMVELGRDNVPSKPYAWRAQYDDMAAIVRDHYLGVPKDD